MVLLNLNPVFFCKGSVTCYICSFWCKGENICCKDTHMDKASSNKIPVLTKSMDIDIWVVVTSNQLFIRDSCSETKFSKKSSYWQNSIFFGRPLCTPHSICLNCGFWQGSFCVNVVLSILVDSTKKKDALVCGKGFCFSENLFQSESIEIVHNFQWLSCQNTPSFK